MMSPLRQKEFVARARVCRLMLVGVARQEYTYVEWFTIS
jgi:hypothetical protein